MPRFDPCMGHSHRVRLDDPSGSFSSQNILWYDQDNMFQSYWLLWCETSNKTPFQINSVKTYLHYKCHRWTSNSGGWLFPLPEQTAVSIALHTYSCLVNLSYFHCHHAFRKASSYTPDKQTYACYYSGRNFFF